MACYQSTLFFFLLFFQKPRIKDKEQNVRKAGLQSKPALKQDIQQSDHFPAYKYKVYLFMINSGIHQFKYMFCCFHLYISTYNNCPNP